MQPLPGPSTIPPPLGITDVSRAPRRSRVIHWAAFGASVLAFALLAAVALRPGPIPAEWALWDLALSVGFLAEFFTRSGFRWAPLRYTASRFFDFVAMVPLGAVESLGLVPNDLVLGLLLAARGVRVVDRLVGDGFVRRQLLLVLAAFEEEIADRVLLRILDRVEGDLQRAAFGKAVARGLTANRDAILDRVHRAALQEGLASDVAMLTGLDAALRGAERRAYDAAVEVLSSSEFDRTLQDVLASSFASMRTEVAQKAWRRQRQGQRPPGPSPP